MNKGMDKIDIYNNSAIILNKKTPKKIISWITILFILLILFVILSFIPFRIYKTFYGYINQDYGYITFQLDSSDFPIDKSDKMYIKNKTYEYEVVEIKNNQVTIKSEIDENLYINNNIIRANLLKCRTTLFEIISNKIKKGIDL